MVSRQLEFLIMYNGESTRAELIGDLVRNLTGSSKCKDNSIGYRDNIIEIRANGMHDAVSAERRADGYIYYPYQIECTPLSDHVRLEDQIALARELDRILQGTGATAICAAFEDLL